MPTPYALVTTVETPVRAAKRDLVRLSRGLERGALADPPAFVDAIFQDARFVTENTRSAYADLAAAGSQVTLYARGLQSWLAPGVTGVGLDDDDPMGDQWCMVLPCPSAPVVFAAVDCDEPFVLDSDRTFSYAMTRDLAIVRACAQLFGH